MNPVRVLHVITDSQPMGGAQRNTLLLLRRLDRAVFESHLACGPSTGSLRDPEGPSGSRGAGSLFEGLVAAAREAGVPVAVIPTLSNAANPVADMAAAMRIGRLCRAGRFDIVHTHSTKAGLLGRAAAAFARAPVIVHTVHGVPFAPREWRPQRLLAKWGERAVSRWTDRFITIGHSLASQFAEARICPAERLVTIRSGIEFSDLDRPVCPRAKRLELGLPENAPVVLAVGHLMTCKGHEVLIEAAARLRPAFPDLRVLIAGEGPLRPRLEQRIGEFGLEGAVLLLGRRDDVAELLQIADVFAQPSLWEGVPRAVQEALYLRCPVVASDVNGTSEVAQDGVTGWLVPPRNAIALAERIAWCLRHPEQARAMGRRGRQWMSEEFSAAQTVARTEALYLSLLAEATMAPTPSCHSEAKPKNLATSKHRAVLSRDPSHSLGMTNQAGGRR